MPSPSEVVDHQYLEMRSRVLALAADFDRVQRHGDLTDERLVGLRACVSELLSDAPGRAERVQLRLSDTTPPPAK